MVGVTKRHSDEGIYQRDVQREKSIRKGSHALLAAMWQAHPNRMRAEFMYGRALTPSEAKKRERDKAAKPVAKYVEPVKAEAPIVPNDNLPLTGKQLVQAVADEFDISYGELIGECRKGYIVCARAVVANILRLRGWSYPRIGRLIGDRDHSTAINLVNKFDRYTGLYPKGAKVFAKYYVPVRHDAA